MSQLVPFLTLPSNKSIDRPSQRYLGNEFDFCWALSVETGKYLALYFSVILRVEYFIRIQSHSNSMINIRFQQLRDIK
jgi:hypothetical protein